MHGLGNVAPVFDHSNDLIGSYEVIDGQVTFRLTRDLDTLDFDDYVL